MNNYTVAHNIQDAVTYLEDFVKIPLNIKYLFKNLDIIGEIEILFRRKHNLKKFCNFYILYYGHSHFDHNFKIYFISDC